MTDDRTHDPLADLVDRSPADAATESDVAPWWRRRPRVSRVVVGVLGVLVLYYVVSLVQVVQAGRAHSSDRVDAIVVLGAAQYDGRPSPQLEARLDHVVTLWEMDVATVVVVTGGNQPGDRFTEAGASQEYLVEHGVPRDAILAEASGTTTFESLDAIAPVLLARGLREVMLVTDPYHAYRSQLTADEVGLDAHVSSTPTSVVTGWGSARRHLEEAAGVALGRLVGFDRLSDLTG